MAIPNLMRVYSVDVSSGTTLSSGINMGAIYEKVYIEIPTMASGSLIIHASSDDSTYYKVNEDMPNQDQEFYIDSSVSQRIVPIPAGFQYYKIENTSGVTDATMTYKLIGINHKN